MLKWLSDWWYGNKAASPFEFEVAGIAPSGVGHVYESPEEYLMAMTINRAWETGNMVVGSIDEDGKVTIEEIRKDNEEENSNSVNQASADPSKGTPGGGSGDDDSAYISDFRLR